jgi:hypothetical protein
MKPQHHKPKEGPVMASAESKHSSPQTSHASSSVASNVDLTHKAFEAWKKLVDEQMARVSSMYEEFARFEDKGLERTRAAVDEMAKLVKDSVAYAGQYAAEWRRVSLEAAKRTADLMTRRA